MLHCIKGKRAVFLFILLTLDLFRMTADSFYGYISILIFVPWLLLLLLPRHPYTERVAFVVGFVLLALAAFFTVQYLRMPTADGGSVLSLEGLRHLFRSPEMLLTGWFNYLSFSLFAGTWQNRDAQELGIPHPWVMLTLVLTFLAGPTGLLVYMGLRWVKTRDWDGQSEQTPRKRRSRTSGS